MALLHAITDLNITVNRHNSFLTTYNEVIWRNPNDVTMKKKMFAGVQVFRKDIGIDRDRVIKELNNMKVKNGEKDT